VNRGQTDAQVQFLARGAGYTVFLTAGESVLTVREPGGTANGEPSADAVRFVPQ
jgi:hypothetical protein